MQNKLPISESQVGIWCVVTSFYLVVPISTLHSFTCQIRIKFSWTEAFSKGGLFGGAKSACESVLLGNGDTFSSLSLPIAETSGTYEQCCVLFNIGALQSQIAKSQNFDSDEGLKSAAKYFQVKL